MPLRTGSEAEPRQGVVLASRGGPGTLPSGTAGGLIASASGAVGPISNTAAETAFAVSYTFPAGGLAIKGGVLMVNAGGSYNTTGNPTLAVRIYLGAVKIFEFAPINTTNNASLERWSVVSRTMLQEIGGGQYNSNPGFSVFRLLSSEEPNSQSAISFFSTVSNILTITVQWGAADPADSITMDNFEVWLWAPQVNLI